MKYLVIVQYYCNCQTNKINTVVKIVTYVYSGHTVF